jgi:hypothetical protein
VRAFSARFDGVAVEALEVSAAEREAAVAALDPQTRADTEFAIAQVRSFAEAQLATMRPLDVETLPGLHLGHRIIPIERVGAYVPGGRYPLLSAPVMTLVPAKVAGCDEVIACLPPGAHPAMVAGCHLSGADRIFRIGGAQAIAAMAFGTESVPAVDKIFGPGNAYVNEAKRQVFGPVGIDQLAGPSEIYVVADETGDAATIATDLLAQAEHDVHTRVGLITTALQHHLRADCVLEKAVVELVAEHLALVLLDIQKATQHRLAAGKLIVGRPLVRRIKAHAAHDNGLTVLVRGDPAHEFDPANGPVRENHTVADPFRSLVAQGGLHSLHDRGPVFRVDLVQRFRKGKPRLGSRTTVERGEEGRRLEHLRGEVEGQCAHAASLDGQRHLVGTRAGIGAGLA